MKTRSCIVALLLLLPGSQVLAQRQRQATPAANAARTLTVVTEPNAIVWIDEIRRGTTDGSGKLDWDCMRR